MKTKRSAEDRTFIAVTVAMGGVLLVTLVIFFAWMTVVSPRLSMRETSLATPTPVLPQPVRTDAIPFQGVGLFVGGMLAGAILVLLILGIARSLSKGGPK